MNLLEHVSPRPPALHLHLMISFFTRKLQKPVSFNPISAPPILRIDPKQNIRPARISKISFPQELIVEREREMRHENIAIASLTSKQLVRCWRILSNRLSSILRILVTAQTKSIIKIEVVELPVIGDRFEENTNILPWKPDSWSDLPHDRHSFLSFRWSLSISSRTLPCQYQMFSELNFFLDIRQT